MNEPNRPERISNVILRVLNRLEERFAHLEGHILKLNPGKPFLTIDEASEYLGIPKATIYQWTAKRLMPHYKRGKRIFFSPKELDEWVLENRIKTNKEIKNYAVNFINEE